MPRAQQKPSPPDVVKVMKNRPKAPAVQIAQAYRSERAVLVDRWIQEQSDPHKAFNEYHFYYENRADADKAIAKGYTACKWKNGNQVQHEGDPLMWIPKDVFEGKEDRAVAISKQILQSAVDGETEEDKKAGLVKMDE